MSTPTNDSLYYVWRGNIQDGFITQTFSQNRDGSFSALESFELLKIAAKDTVYTLVSNDVFVQKVEGADTENPPPLQHSEIGFANCEMKNGELIDENEKFLTVFTPQDDDEDISECRLEIVGSVGSYVFFEIYKTGNARCESGIQHTRAAFIFDLNKHKKIYPVDLVKDISRAEQIVHINSIHHVDLVDEKRLTGVVAVYPTWEEDGKFVLNARYAYRVPCDETDGTWSDNLRSVIYKKLSPRFKPIDVPKAILDFWNECPELPHGVSQT